MATSQDLTIVGGGIAGMTAAICAARADLDVLLLEREICGGLANSTYSIENFLSYSRINGMELMQKVKHHAESLKVGIEEIAEVENFEFDAYRKTVSTSEQRYHAKSIILATGRVPIHLPIETDWEEHIHYCSVCDGISYKGKDLVLVGGDNSSFDESLYLIDLGVRSIFIIETMETCAAEEVTQKKAFATGRIAARTNARLSAIIPQAGRGRIVVEDIASGSSEDIAADGVFVFIGQRPNTRGLECKIDLDSNGYIVADYLMHTTLPGVFAAGDVIAKKYRQLTTAMSDGTIAALEAVKYIRECA